MKKILTTILAVLLAGPSFAQLNSGGFSVDGNSIYYGVRLGANFASIGGDDFRVDGMKVGLNLAGVIGLRLSDTTPLFLESGLYYTERGAKDGKDKVGLTYLEIPLLIKYGVQATDDIALLPFIGPYFSYGIAGKTKYKYVEEGIEVNYNERSYKDFFNHSDMGIKLGCGAEYNKLYLELGYQFGLANIADFDDASCHGNALFLNFGVNF
ncbi:MAG: PorT family protein [Prevotella sp.]|nr:PorT family protein [Prevotella sp.]